MYTASSVSLAALEVLVHVAKSDSLKSYTLFSVDFDDSQVSTLDVTWLPANWQDYPAPSELQELGEAWIAGMKSLVLSVPSAIVPDESNYLVNPARPVFASLDLKNPRQFRFDQRLLHP